VWIIAAVVLAAARRHIAPVALVAVAVAAAEIAATAIKLASGRLRPYVGEPEPPPLVTTHLDLTFPSGHATTSFAAAVVLSSLVERRTAIAGFVALAFAIAASRVYVGVHYPSDVLAGALLGAVVGAAVVAAARSGRVRALRWPRAGRRR
jgi:undecaprenyl-diphosphatase